MEEALRAALLAVLALQEPSAGSKEAALWDGLRARLERVERGLDGVMAVSVRDLSNGRTIEVRPQEPFATASCIKPAVLLELYHAAAAGRVDLQEAVPPPSPRVGGGGVLELLGDRARLTRRDLAVLMMSYSDNDAANALIDTLGLDAVNRRLRALGLPSTQLRRRLMDGAAARQGQENVSTAREMRGLMEALRAAAGLPPALAADMKEVAALPKRSEFEVAEPAGTTVLAKTGLLEGVRCWAAVVELPGRPYSAAVMTGHLGRDADGEAALREVAAALYSTFQRLARDSEYGRSNMRD
jgi:beta-lactamase class A